MAAPAAAAGAATVAAYAPAAGASAGAAHEAFWTAAQNGLAKIRMSEMTKQ